MKNIRLKSKVTIFFHLHINFHPQHLEVMGKKTMIYGGVTRTFF